MIMSKSYPLDCSFESLSSNKKINTTFNYTKQVTQDCVTLFENEKWILKVFSNNDIEINPQFFYYQRVAFLKGVILPHYIDHEYSENCQILRTVILPNTFERKKIERTNRYYPVSKILEMPIPKSEDIHKLIKATTSYNSSIQVTYSRHNLYDENYSYTGTSNKSTDVNEFFKMFFDCVPKEFVDLYKSATFIRFGLYNNSTSSNDSLNQLKHLAEFESIRFETKQLAKKGLLLE